MCVLFMSYNNELLHIDNLPPTSYHISAASKIVHRARHYHINHFLGSRIFYSSSNGLIDVVLVPITEKFILRIGWPIR
jgi:hypothetical protein